MALSFPNQSRSFDATRQAVRFWGYENAMEASFFVAVDALRRLEPRTTLDESGFLRTFDQHRDLICSTATKVFARGYRGSYNLWSSDF